MTECCCRNGLVMADVDTRRLVEDYIRHHLDKHGLRWQSARHKHDRTPEPGPVEQTMRALGDEFEDRYRDVFEEMNSQLEIKPNTARKTFVGVVSELFNDGINWGRIVALFAFGATLAVQCVRNGDPELVDQLIDWITEYVDNHLHSWIQEHNGWNGFIEFYKGGPDSRPDSAWPSLKKLCGYAVGALSVLTLGAILSQKS